jgi:Ca2+-binding EF-hand superfamily protein
MERSNKGDNRAREANEHGRASPNRVSRRNVDDSNAVHEMRKVFDKFDVSGSGEIDAWDVNKALTELGRHKLPDERIFDLIRTADDTEKGTVPFPRFVQVNIDSILLVCDHLA